MITAQIEQISCSHLDQICVGRLPKHRRLRCCHGGLKQPLISNAAHSAEFLKHGGMNLSHLTDRQVNAVIGSGVHQARRDRVLR